MEYNVHVNEIAKGFIYCYSQLYDFIKCVGKIEYCELAEWF